MVSECHFSSLYAFSVEVVYSISFVRVFSWQTAAPMLMSVLPVHAAATLKVHEAAQEVAAVCRLDLQGLQKHLLNVSGVGALQLTRPH